MPTPEKFATCPQEDKILQFYEGQFESVFILLHPFIKPITLGIDRFCPSKWPSKNEILTGCEPVCWVDVGNLAGLYSLSEIDVVLRTNIGGLRKEISNICFADKLNAVTENYNIVQPTEGEISPFLENRLYRVIQSIGHRWLWVGDEFGTERKLWLIDDLVEKDVFFVMVVFLPTIIAYW